LYKFLGFTYFEVILTKVRITSKCVRLGNVYIYDVVEIVVQD